VNRAFHHTKETVPARTRIGKVPAAQGTASRGVHQLPGERRKPAEDTYYRKKDIGGNIRRETDFHSRKSFYNDGVLKEAPSGKIAAI